MRKGRRRWAVVPASIGAALTMGAVLWFTAVGLAKPAVRDVSATLVDAGDHNVPVASPPPPPTGSPPYCGARELVAIKVTATLTTTQEEWRSTSYAFGSGSPTCVNTANHDTRDTFTEYVDVTLPETTPTRLGDGAALHRERLLGFLASAEATFTIRARTTNQVLAPHCDTRVALAFWMSLDRSASTPGARQAVIDGSKAFVNGLVDSGAQLAVLEFNSSARTVSLGSGIPGSPLRVYNNVTPSVRGRAVRELHQRPVQPGRLDELGRRVPRGQRSDSETRTGRVPNRRRPHCAESRA